MKNFFSTNFNALMHFIYPNKCLSCSIEMKDHSVAFCPICRDDLNYTFFEKYNEASSLDKIFWGRQQLKATYAMLYFEKNKMEQKILHAIKYDNQGEIAKGFGEELGKRVKTMAVFNDLDALLPVPLHPKKELIRGYNQAELLAQGIATVTNVPLEKTFLHRKVFTESQTKKDRENRWLNMQGKFDTASLPEKIKHVAIVDDVITTGATLENLINLIKSKNPQVQISVISLAFAR